MTPSQRQAHAVGSLGKCVKAVFNVDRPDWQQFAACRGIDTSLFFPRNALESAQAKAIIKPICETCVVFEYCYTFAVSFPEKALQGIWANTTDNDRRRIRHSATPIRYRVKTPDKKGPT